VDAGDLEQLAEIVLNGEGGSLVGLKSQEPEIQAFLNNVPSYMVSQPNSRKEEPLSEALITACIIFSTSHFPSAGENTSRARCGT